MEISYDFHNPFSRTEKRNHKSVIAQPRRMSPYTTAVRPPTTASTS